MNLFEKDLFSPASASGTVQLILLSPLPFIDTAPSFDMTMTSPGSSVPFHSILSAPLLIAGFLIKPIAVSVHSGVVGALPSVVS